MNATPSPSARRNDRLRAVRLVRNWSQDEFAEAIRTQAATMNLNLACDAKRVGRWERGEVRWPSPAYRRVLCALLDVADVAELGFVPPFRLRLDQASSPVALSDTGREAAVLPARSVIARCEYRSGHSRLVGR